MHTLPQLPYNYSALEPHIDARTMQIHHSKHHQGYVDKLNAALENYPELQDKTIEDLLQDTSSLPQAHKTAIINNGGGHANHSLFWTIMAPDAADKPSADLAQAIDSTFGNFDSFKQEFADTAAGQFGSGWAWLALDNNRLKILSTSNQDSPLSMGFIPLLNLDVWEHAYYLKYQNKRGDYIDNFMKLVNWDVLEEKCEGLF